MLDKAAKEERRKQEEKFIDLCEKDDVESVNTLIAEDISILNSKDRNGKSYMQ